MTDQPSSASDLATLTAGRRPTTDNSLSLLDDQLLG